MLILDILDLNQQISGTPQSIHCSLDTKLEVNLPILGEYSPSVSRKYVVDPKGFPCVDLDFAVFGRGMNGPLAQLVRASC